MKYLISLPLAVAIAVGLTTATTKASTNCPTGQFCANALSYTSTGTTYACLSGGCTNSPPQLNHTQIGCSDCAATIPCSGGGSGALAVRENSSWNCATGAGSVLANAILQGQLNAEIGGQYNILNHGAVCDGAHNDSLAIQATAVLACPNGLCQHPIYVPPTPSGCYTHGLVLNPSTLGSTSGCAFGLRIVGNGGRVGPVDGGSTISGRNQSLIIVDSSASVGVDLFGDGNTAIQGVAIISGTNKPTALLGYGKTTTCDSDIHLIRDSYLYNAHAGGAALFSYGGENMSIQDSQLETTGSGTAGLYWSAVNTLGIVPTGVTLKTGPVSATTLSDNGANSVVHTNGGTGVYLDTGVDATGGTVQDLYFHDLYFNLGGSTDRAFWDGRTVVSTNVISELSIDNIRAEANNASPAGEEFIELGSTIVNAKIRGAFGSTADATAWPFNFHGGVVASDIALTGRGSGNSVTGPNFAASIVRWPSGSTHSVPNALVEMSDSAFDFGRSVLAGINLGGALASNSSIANFLQDANGHNLFSEQRATDTSPSGWFHMGRSHDNAMVLYSVDVLGNSFFQTDEIAKLGGTPAAGPGGSSCQLFAVAGTNAGTCKIQVLCGTSVTPVTIVDNVGAGC